MGLSGTPQIDPGGGQNMDPLSVFNGPVHRTRTPNNSPSNEGGPYLLFNMYRGSVYFYDYANVHMRVCTGGTYFSGWVKFKGHHQLLQRPRFGREVPKCSLMAFAVHGESSQEVAD